VSDILARLAVGATALRRPATLAAVIGLTVLPFAVGVVTFSIVARSLGVELTPAQAALVTGAVGLSFSIPAAPGSIGTYEFVGVTVMSSYGVSAEVALANVLLVHLLVTVSTSLAGLVAAWQLHFRVGSIADAGAVTTGAQTTAESDVG
jgi:hypothetical protein